MGSGSYPYVKNSVLLDFSKEMLKSAGKAYKHKVLYDLDNETLPFKSESFNSITAVFIINYIKNPEYVLKEAKRVLNKKGKIIIVQSSKPIAYFYKIKQKKSWSAKEIEKILKQLKFKTKIIKKKINNTELVFIEGGR